MSLVQTVRTRAVGTCWPMWVVLLGFLGLSLPRTSLADATGGQAMTFLVLGIQVDGQLDPELRTQVANQIATGYGSALTPDLEATETELLCTKLACLQALAARLNEPQYILYGAVTTLPALPSGDGGPQRTRIVLKVYHTGRQEVFSPKPEAELVGSCQPQASTRSDCERLLLTELVSRVLLHVPKKQDRRDESYLTFRRGLFQGVFAGLTISGFAVGSAVSFAQGSTYQIQNPDPSLPMLTVYPQLHPFIGAAFTVAGVGAVGSLGSALWGLHQGPYRAAKRKERRDYLKGLFLGSMTSLFVTTLLTAGIVQGYEGRNCLTNSNRICTFPASRPALWGMTALTAAGLGTALAITIKLD